MIQGESSIFGGGDIIGNCEIKMVYMSMCLIWNGYRDTAV